MLYTGCLWDSLGTNNKCESWGLCKAKLGRSGSRIETEIRVTLDVVRPVSLHAF